MSLGRKRWLRQSVRAEAEEIARELGILPAVAAVLLNRGIKDVQSAHDFLNPSLAQLHSPWLMGGMERSVERIDRALRANEKIIVYGDYDADGICATAILVETLEILGGRVDYYLPSRFNEGYGLQREALEKIKNRGAGLVVTVDCGINAAGEAVYAREIGLDLIITDHHQPLGTAVEAVAVLNPLKPGCGYPFKYLSGSGIAFKLAAALLETRGRDFPAELLDLAALGTVADVAPLLGENRSIVAVGLEEISRLRRPGLKALATVNALSGSQINSSTVAFILAPSINAPGRLGEAEPAVQLLLARDEKTASDLAQKLKQENILRRETEQQVMVEAEAVLLADPAVAGERVITLAAEGWHQGTIGIVASRLAERYWRPVVLVALENGKGRGSARSIPGFDITAALAAGAELLERFGGHEQAAGLTVTADQVARLRASLNRYAAKHMDEASLLPGLILDDELSEHEISSELARQLSRLQPFGTGNPKPQFFARGWELQSWRLVGAHKNHLKLMLSGENRRIEPIFFSGAYLEPQLSPGRDIELALSLKEGFFRASPVVEIELKDLRYRDSGFSGPVEVVDRRDKGDRARRINDLIIHIPGAAIFVSTIKRRADLEKNLPPGSMPIILTGGGGKGSFSANVAPADLILYDLPLYDETLELYFRRRPPEGQVRVHLLYEKTDLEINKLLLEMTLPDLAALAQIGQALMETAAAEAPVDFSTIKRIFPFQPAQSFWQRCRNILTETEILSPAGLLRPAVGFEEGSWRERLECSSAYRETRELKQRCLRFQNKLLEASPDELAAYWSSRLTRAAAIDHY